MGIVFVTPPPAKPSEPGISAGAAAAFLRHLGSDARSIDASIAWHRYALAPQRLRGSLREAPNGAAVRALRAGEDGFAVLRQPGTYGSRERYTSAIALLENALRLAAAAYPGLSLGVAHIRGDGVLDRSESSAWLVRMASEPGPFDAYFQDELIPWLAAEGATHVAVSLTFQPQAPAAFRLAALLRDRLPGVRRYLGGPLVACWQAARLAICGAPFDLFEGLFAGEDRDLRGLAAELGAEAPARGAESLVRAPGLDEVNWEEYLSPMPTVPVAIGRGCYWGKCSFCPDHLHGADRPCEASALQSWLREVAERFPGGAMLHLTDSAVPVGQMAEIAGVIERERLPIRWHGFCRLEPEFAEPGFADGLVRGGCAMLQFGVESAAPRLLGLLGKGAGVERARGVLRATAAAGIRNYVYLLFGIPTETDAEREQTLQFVAEEAGSIHALNAALLNLPKQSPMHRHPHRFGITELLPFSDATDLSLYEDFRCGNSHPRPEARRWLAERFERFPAVRGITAGLRVPMKAHHLCFL